MIRPLRSVVVLMALAGALAVGLLTSRYGPGLTTDSLSYLAAARSLATVGEVTSAEGTPLTMFPPLYPCLLALVGTLAGSDPLTVVPWVNAALFGLVVLGTGLLMERHLSLRPVFILGAFCSLVSFPHFQVAVMAWSEPLFICLVLFFLLTCDSLGVAYEPWQVPVMAITAGCACLTRYAGVVLIPIGALVLWRGSPSAAPGKPRDQAVFLAGSSLGVLAWGTRNVLLTGMATGPRPPAAASLAENVGAMAQTVAGWVVPLKSPEGRLAVLGCAVVFLAAAGAWAGHRDPDVRRRLWRTVPLGAFMLSYCAFVVVAASYTAVDPVGTRLLAPIYGPLVVCLFTLVDACGAGRGRGVLAAVSAVGLLLPLCTVSMDRSTLLAARYLRGQGLTYGGRAWRTNQLLDYLARRSSLFVESVVYSNHPQFTRVMAHVGAFSSPVRAANRSTEPALRVQALRGIWPPAEGAFLVWFAIPQVPNLFTPQELMTVAAFDVVFSCPDGTVWRVRPR